MNRHQLTLLVASFCLLWASVALAEPCGEIPAEGACFGDLPKYCNSQGELIEKEACGEQCCGWSGVKYACLPCPESGACIPECNTPDVFGCNLQNTHEWTCEVDETGCVRRVFKRCPEGQICDEAGTHKCQPKENVNLCGGVPTTGVCDGSIFKQCVNNAIEFVDCAAQGQACGKNGCGSCSPECSDGEMGCDPDGRAWSCMEDPQNGCWVKARKNCGVKSCIEGICQFPGDAEPEAATVAEPAPIQEAEPDPVPDAANNKGGGCVVAAADDGVREGTLVLFATLLGFLLFVKFASVDPK